MAIELKQLDNDEMNVILKLAGLDGIDVDLIKSLELSVGENREVTTTIVYMSAAKYD